MAFLNIDFDLISTYFQGNKDSDDLKIFKLKLIDNYLIKYSSESLMKQLILKNNDKCFDYFESSSDLVPNQYEGGFKVWEGTMDLIQYLDENKILEQFKDTKIKILELGCGGGLVGIYCLNKLPNSIVYFQDFNSHVLEYFTATNLVANFGKTKIDFCKFIAGDWNQVAENFSQTKFDLIITSETIYNEDNYSKLINVFKNCLSSCGTVYLASKCYYFGVGGGTESFQEFVKNDATFQVEICSEIDAPLQRLILKLNFR